MEVNFTGFGSNSTNSIRLQNRKALGVRSILGLPFIGVGLHLHQSL